MASTSVASQPAALTTTRTLTITLSEPVYRKVKRAADLTYRSIDEVLESTINAALAAPPDLPPDLADELAAMHLFSDEALWAASRPSLSVAEQERLHQLNHAAAERSLTQAEQAEQTALLDAYHRSVLRRAQALSVLNQRGHHIPLQPSL